MRQNAWQAGANAKRQIPEMREQKMEKAANIIDQHLGWLKMFICGMNEKNWRDNRLYAERQLEHLCTDLDKERAGNGQSAGAEK